MYELKWSHAEKTVARRAFDLAFGKELEALLQEAKDYRYSILPLVFAQLLRAGRLTEDDLHGLGQEKLDLIRIASAI
jgi:hypothetical protein